MGRLNSRHNRPRSQSTTSRFILAHFGLFWQGLCLIVLNRDKSGRDKAIKTGGVETLLKKTPQARSLVNVKRETKAGIGLVLLILAIIALPNPYGTWLVALVVIIAMILGGMNMANSDNWIDGLVIAIIVTVGLLLMVFIGSGGGGGG